MLKNKRKIALAIGAHPDDIEFSCTGSLLNLKEKGYEAYYVIATNGENGFKAGYKPRKQRMKIRYHEQLNAANILGVKKVYFLGHKDGFLENSDDLRQELVKIIRKVKPEIIFSFDPANRTFENINLQHRDHRKIGKSVFDAVFAARNSYIYPGKAFQVSYLYLFGTDRPNYFENINKQIKKKIEILSAHKSQFSDFDKVADWVRNYLSKFTRKYKYSEAFRIVKIERIFA
jgi:LmbE family N-acetylglucosaminyl deacetylase